jgi:hypothetical protein
MRYVPSSPGRRFLSAMNAWTFVTSFFATRAGHDAGGAGCYVAGEGVQATSYRLYSPMPNRRGATTTPKLARPGSRSPVSGIPRWVDHDHIVAEGSDGAEGSGHSPAFHVETVTAVLASHISLASAASAAVLASSRVAPSRSAQSGMPQRPLPWPDLIKWGESVLFLCTEMPD